MGCRCPAWRVGVACANRLADAHTALASSPRVQGWPSQKARTVSRKPSFHSAQPGAKLPVWWPSGPTSHGSAIRCTPASTGSCAMAANRAWWGLKRWASAASRPSDTARSNRKPSTPCTCTHQRRLSITQCITRGWLTFRLLPQPLKLWGTPLSAMAYQSAWPRPRQLRVGPSGSLSQVWLNTTSSTTSSPAACNAATMAVNSACTARACAASRGGWPAVHAA